MLGSGSRIGRVRVCYGDRAADPTRFSIQMQVWSASSDDEKMWLSRIGQADGALVWDDCEEVSPSDDKVITEFAMTAHETEGITGIKVTFSSDFSNQNENPSDNHEVFQFGSMMKEQQPSGNNHFEFVYNDIS